MYSHHLAGEKKGNGTDIFCAPSVHPLQGRDTGRRRRILLIHLPMATDTDDKVCSASIDECSNLF